MKRTIKIRADGAYVKLRITAEADTNGLVREEVAEFANQLTSRLMEALPGLRYMNLTLAEVRVVK